MTNFRWTFLQFHVQKEYDPVHNNPTKAPIKEDELVVLKAIE